jgi:RimJ/RimL family protein N-acetyltransferase
MDAREPIPTERLVLVPVGRALAAAVVGGDLSGVPAGAGWPHADTLDGLRMAVEHGTDLGWFVTLDGLVIGDCGTHGPPDAAGTVEIGYGLAGPHRGRGFATELCRALTARLLAEPDVRRVVACTHGAANPASRRVLEKSGFTFDRDDGELAWYECRDTERSPRRAERARRGQDP